MAVYWLHAPLPFHETALPAALGTQAAADQGKFWEFHAELLDEDARHDHEALLQIAEKIGLDTARSQGIPSLFINGDLVVGDRSIETLIETVERTLEQE